MSWKTERQRGLKEAPQQFAVLGAHWPLAFPDKSHLVRPLAGSIIPQICATLGWSPGYTRSVLARWKQRRAYCSAVLCYAERIDLDGNLTDEAVLDVARSDAKAQLARLKAAQAGRAARDLEKQQQKEALLVA